MKCAECQCDLVEETPDNLCDRCWEQEIDERANTFKLKDYLANDITQEL
jgi:hypothetical protein